MKAYMGIELGVDQIKAVLISDSHAVIAQESHPWQSTLENGVWSYALEAVWAGLRDVVGRLLRGFREPITIEGLGISGMMHGYMPFDAQGNLLVPYRTWQNTFTGKASLELTALFGRNIAQRWSVAHLYHAVLAEEPHTRHIARVSTLASYVHYRLTGEFVTGIGDAVGVFPLEKEQYCPRCMAQFNEIITDYALPWTIGEVLPSIRKAGEFAGVLTGDGARLLDSTGKLKPGIPLAPPESGAGTSLVANHCVTPHTGVVSADADIYAMTVLDKPLSRAYPEIDIVATPCGKPVAMVHCDNCMADLNAWMKTYLEFCGVVKAHMDEGTLMWKLYQESLRGDADCGGVTVVGYMSGEVVTDFESGCPLMLRNPTGKFTLANFLRAQLYSAVASLAIGMRILRRENVSIARLTGFGSFFNIPGVGQQVLADAVNAPVAVADAAMDGGAYGMALLTAYHVNRAPNETLESYLDHVFGSSALPALSPDPEGVKGFQIYLSRFERALKVERTAVSGNFF